MAPPETAMAVSYWAYEPGTFAERKGRRRGRQYLPYLSTTPMDAHGMVDSGYITSFADHYRDFFNDVQGMHAFNEDTPPDADADYWDFVVVSGIDATWENVNFLSIDNHYDSQRRRQHQVPASRQVRTISHA